MQSGIKYLSRISFLGVATHGYPYLDDLADWWNFQLEIDKLRERVRVLEKLLTDDDRRLADEIERLRRTETVSRI